MYAATITRSVSCVVVASHRRGVIACPAWLLGHVFRNWRGRRQQRANSVRADVPRCLKRMSQLRGATHALHHAGTVATTTGRIAKIRLFYKTTKR